jgi:hypothetical protein
MDRTADMKLGVFWSVKRARPSESLPSFGQALAAYVGSNALPSNSATDVNRTIDSVMTAKGHYRRFGRKPEIVWCASTTGSARRTETLRRRASNGSPALTLLVANESEDGDPKSISWRPTPIITPSASSRSCGR